VFGHKCAAYELGLVDPNKHLRPIHLAVWAGHVGLVKQLLDLGADIPPGVLLTAVWNEHRQLAETLLVRVFQLAVRQVSEGKTISVPGHRGRGCARGALVALAEETVPEISQRLAPGDTVEWACLPEGRYKNSTVHKWVMGRQCRGLNMLCLAAMNGEVELVRMMLAHDMHLIGSAAVSIVLPNLEEASLNAVHLALLYAPPLAGRGASHLEGGREAAFKEVVRMLLEACMADVRAPVFLPSILEGHSFGAISLACIQGYWEAAAEMIRLDVELARFTFRVPLHCTAVSVAAMTLKSSKQPVLAVTLAAAADATEAVKAMITAGSPVETATWRAAALSQHMSAIRVLLEMDWRPARGQMRESGLDAALLLLCQRGATDLARRVVAAGATVDTECLHAAVSRGRLGMVQYLLKESELGAAYSGPEAYPLDDLAVQATRHGHQQLAGWLVHRGASPTSCCEEKCALLHYACLWNHSDLVLLLLESGAPLSVEDQYGYTPLAYALGFGHREQNALMEALAQDADCRSATHTAVLRLVAELGWRQSAKQPDVGVVSEAAGTKDGGNEETEADLATTGATTPYTGATTPYTGATTPYDSENGGTDPFMSDNDPDI
ncbi:hypothetical protein CYMTET_50118, partial [Cymbomonas tetramitiformis]